MLRSLYRWPSRITCRSYRLRGGRDGTDTFTGKRTLDDAAHGVFASLHLQLLRRTCAEPPSALERQTDALVGPMVHANQQGIFVRVGRPRAPPALPSRRSSAVRRDFSRVDWTQSSSAWPMRVNSSPACREKLYNSLSSVNSPETTYSEKERDRCFSI